MIGVMGARCLSVHAGYRCRHSGACCSGVFPIPAEPAVMEFVRRETAALGGTRGTRGQISIFGGLEKSRSDPAFLPKGMDGACVFFERDTRLCALHRLGGTAALPASCRHFPRAFLHDNRGISLSLSHFCPTAAGLLLEDVPLEIVQAPPPLALDGDVVEAFDAVGALPPLLRPGVLMDLDAFDAWEKAAVATLARNDLSCDGALNIIDAASERLRTWTPGSGSLAATVGEAFRTAGPLSPPIGNDELLELVGAALEPRGFGLQRSSPDASQLLANEWSGLDRPLRRYLAAKLFANRIAYEVRGLRSLVAWLRLCVALLRNEAARLRSSFTDALRAADLILVHRVDTGDLAASLARIEQS